jgi:hypothetical protein
MPLRGLKVAPRSLPQPPRQGVRYEEIVRGASSFDSKEPSELRFLKSRNFKKQTGMIKLK